MFGLWFVTWSSLVVLLMLQIFASHVISTKIGFLCDFLGECVWGGRGIKFPYINWNDWVIFYVGCFLPTSWLLYHCVILSLVSMYIVCMCPSVRPLVCRDTVIVWMYFAFSISVSLIFHLLNLCGFFLSLPLWISVCQSDWVHIHHQPASALKWQQILI